MMKDAGKTIGSVIDKQGVAYFFHTRSPIQGKLENLHLFLRQEIFRGVMLKGTMKFCENAANKDMRRTTADYRFNVDERQNRWMLIGHSRCLLRQQVNRAHKNPAGR